MKKNFLPLLGIAFVVALAASGIFYGLFVNQLRTASQSAVNQTIVVAARPLDRGTVLKASDLKIAQWPGALPPGAARQIDAAVGKTIYASMEENEPVTEHRTSVAKAMGGIGIPKGMRAISVHVIDSGGIIPLLHPGYRVDVQAIKSRNSPEADLRTILQNVEVLSIQANESANQNAPATVTLLTTPQDADRVALADSGANVRLLLRNPLDPEAGARAGLHLAALFNDAPLERRTNNPTPTVRAATPAPQTENLIELVVRFEGLSAQAMKDVLSRIPGAQEGGSIQAYALPMDKEGQQYWTLLEQRADLELFSLTHVTAANLQESRFQAGSAFSMRFQPRIQPDRSLQLRIQPEVSSEPAPTGIATRKLVADLHLQAGQSLLVTGLSEPGETPALAERLFGKHVSGTSHRELLMLVTPHLKARPN